jgi:hypothetical protein
VSGNVIKGNAGAGGFPEGVLNRIGFRAGRGLERAEKVEKVAGRFPV